MVANRQYEYGTSPRKLDDYNVRKKVANTQKKKSVRVNKKAVFMNKVKLVASVAVFFAVIFTISYRYSLVDRKFKEIQGIKKEYIALQTANDQIELGLKSDLDLTTIERHAKDKLGMQKPIASQIKYVDIEKQDRVELNENVVLKENIFEKVFNNVAKLLD